jgi:hypothetical protein
MQSPQKSVFKNAKLEIAEGFKNTKREKTEGFKNTIATVQGVFTFLKRE